MAGNPAPLLIPGARLPAGRPLSSPGGIPRVLPAGACIHRRRKAVGDGTAARCLRLGMGTPPDGVREMRGQLGIRSGEIDGGGQVADPRGGEAPMRNRGMSHRVGLAALAGAVGRGSTTLPRGVGGIAGGSHAGAGPGGRDPQVRRCGGPAIARGSGPGRGRVRHRGHGLRPLAGGTGWATLRR